ncbi:core-2/I-branching beta-1,6-N-acetylglucosaminyltransferase family protein [Actinidia rufa]|uniref:Core-2/I-branching beta-1,6-N-acetylglucosaminyltransferase family protein n=1 Tax=Actinidia rufa TaxID=165716 RepID=A0A7J0EZL5_9ERIC|nr:core-2/I-branching beta-1,6-N-acetylglucosaminyltransferase family protein [Actinidia rufa]
MEWDIEEARGGDQRSEVLTCPLRRNESIRKNPSGRVDLHCWIGVYVYVVSVGGFGSVGEEFFSERSEVEVGIGEEEEGNFGLWVGGAEAGLGRGEGLMLWRIGGGLVEERELVELVVRRDGDGAKREYARGQQEEERERE